MLSPESPLTSLWFCSLWVANHCNVHVQEVELWMETERGFYDSGQFQMRG